MTLHTDYPVAIPGVTWFRYAVLVAPEATKMILYCGACEELSLLNCSNPRLSDPRGPVAGCPDDAQGLAKVRKGSGRDIPRPSLYPPGLELSRRG